MIALLLGLAHAGTLDEALAAARAYAPPLAAVSAAADAARAGQRQGRADLAPVLTAGAGLTAHNYEVAFEVDGSQVVVQPLLYPRASVGLAAALTPAGLAELAARDAATAAALDDQDAAGPTVALAVTEAFYALLVAEEAVEVQAGLLALAEGQERVAVAREAAGLADERATLQAALATSRARRELEAARAAHVSAAAALRAWTGREESGSAVWPALPAEGPQGARSEVEAARARLEAAERRVRAAWTLWMPGLSAGLTYAWSGVTGFAGRGDLLTAGLDASWTLPVGGTHAFTRARWSAEARAAAASLREVEDAVEVQAAVARAELARAHAAEDAVAAELGLAERHHALTARAFELGAASALEVDEALAALRATRLAAVRERASAALAAWRLAWAEGRLAW